ncbi:von Willebrand factor C domain-containing protein 2-like [Saccostrea echinata]|uniref:von Willebrand factor C domain-containing protein 2-like n=1 Tax=Saccostrea echinata TaxID=191078 RepID=UPI002A7F06A7|nr:von Willebrand factor C domain-containing protein 2-like [Saccostrea echinata]
MAHQAILSIYFLATAFLVVGSRDFPILATTVPGCLYHGKWYQAGSFQHSPCEPCQCTSSGQAYCAIVDCFFDGCVDAVHDPNKCCPQCPNGRNCKAPDGTIIKHGDTYNTPTMSCQCSSFGTLAQCASLAQPHEIVAS